MTTWSEFMASLPEPDPKEISEVTSRLRAMSPSERAEFMKKMEDLFVDVIKKNFGDKTLV